MGWGGEGKERGNDFLFELGPLPASLFGKQNKNSGARIVDFFPGTYYFIFLFGDGCNVY